MCRDLFVQGQKTFLECCYDRQQPETGPSSLEKYVGCLRWEPQNLARNTGGYVIQTQDDCNLGTPEYLAPSFGNVLTELYEILCCFLAHGPVRIRRLLVGSWFCRLFPGLRYRCLAPRRPREGSQWVIKTAIQLSVWGLQVLFATLLGTADGCLLGPRTISKGSFLREGIE